MKKALVLALTVICSHAAIACAVTPDLASTDEETSRAATQGVEPDEIDFTSKATGETSVRVPGKIEFPNLRATDTSSATTTSDGGVTYGPVITIKPKG